MHDVIQQHQNGHNLAQDTQSNVLFMSPNYVTLHITWQVNVELCNYITKNNEQFNLQREGHTVIMSHDVMGSKM